jgi:hypothetical protein
MWTRRRLSLALVLVLALAVGAVMLRAVGRRALAAGLQAAAGRKTVAARVAQYGAAARARLAPELARTGIAYPPARMTLVGLKAERTLEVWVAAPAGQWQHLKDYPILGLSGTLGPKLREGDRQVPEGLYGVAALNPNSLYHLALRVNYPNAADRRQAQADGRTALGGDIMIHGNTCSVGCLAMGDTAAEELFVLAAATGLANVAVILSPVDFRVRELPPDGPPPPAWTAERYAAIRQALADLRPPVAATP